MISGALLAHSDAPTHDETIINRFWEKVDRKRDGSCWNWKGCIGSNGYGHFKLFGVAWGAHVVAYALTNGSVPRASQVCHTCDNRKCCNPAHLWLGTARQNALDKVSKGRARGRYSRPRITS